jgi:hypothetical protein
LAVLGGGVGIDGSAVTEEWSLGLVLGDQRMQHA